MKVLIWGTGWGAKNFLSGIEDIVDSVVVAFVDNDKRKTGGCFFDKPIIAPSDIKEYCFDKIIILSIYENNIRSQIKNDLGLDESIIIGAADADNIISQILIEDYSILSKRILVIGDEDTYNRIKDYCNDIFNITGFINAEALEDITKYEFDNIMLTDYRNSSCQIFDMPIKKMLAKKYDIKPLIFTTEIYARMRLMDRKESWGEDNSEKTFLVIRLGGGGGGLGAFTLAVENCIHYALEKGYIPVVDMMTYPNQYMKKEEVGKVNAWEKFFEQPAGYSLSDIANSKNIVIVANKHFLKRECKDFFFLKEKMVLIEKTENFAKKLRMLDKKVLGVLVRGTDYVNLHPYGHAIQPDVEMVIRKVKESLQEWKGYENIYLCTEVQEIVTRFQEEFGNRLFFYPQKRFREDCTEYLCEYKFDRDDDEYYRGEDYWVALKVLSQCDALIAGSCGGTTVALKLNDNKYEHTYIFDLGRYGIDNVKLDDKD